MHQACNGPGRRASDRGGAAGAPRPTPLGRLAQGPQIAAHAGGAALCAEARRADHALRAEQSAGCRNRGCWHPRPQRSHRCLPPGHHTPLLQVGWLTGNQAKRHTCLARLFKMLQKLAMLSLTLFLRAALCTGLGCCRHLHHTVSRLLVLSPGQMRVVTTRCILNSVQGRCAGVHFNKLSIYLISCAHNHM